MDLLIDGYLAQTFGPRDAESYFVRLLRVDARLLRPTVPQECPHAFVITSPAVRSIPPSLSINGQPAWLLDYAIRQVGTVVPQRPWTPGYPPNSQRYTTSMKMPIFFIHKDRINLGLPLIQAVAGDCEMLLGASAAAPLGNCSSMYIRINWPGYNEWATQIMTRDQTSAHNTIVLQRFVERVARAEAQQVHGQDPNWRISIGEVTKEQVILIGAVQVSQGSWQPILQLNCYVVPRCQHILRLPYI
ncbi:hypothetical protein BC827DRAFT_1158308 [Russula dissimulans]|nr:hypothetical protein BC827DRAFT_1158308 [Russula dissimulans]